MLITIVVIMLFTLWVIAMSIHVGLLFGNNESAKKVSGYMPIVTLLYSALLFLVWLAGNLDSKGLLYEGFAYFAIYFAAFEGIMLFGKDISAIYHETRRLKRY